MLVARDVAQISNDAAALLANLKGEGYAKAVAQNKFGFRAYKRLGDLRKLAITKPTAYLTAKTVRIIGGKSPKADEAASGSLSADDILTLYGTAPEKDVPGVAGEVTGIYASTLTSLYDAGADEKTAEQYATAVAQSLLQSKMAVIESEFPDIIDNTSERNLLLNQLGTVSGRLALSAPKLKSIAHK